MPWFDFLWVPGEDGDIEHVTEHGVSLDEVEDLSATLTELKQAAPAVILSHSAIQQRANTLP